MAAFNSEDIRVVVGKVIETRPAWTYNNLGLVRDAPLFVKARWLVIHLNSGHAIARVDGGSLEAMQAMVAEIADAGDWSFDGLKGFENMFPDAAQRTHEIVTKHRPDLRRRVTNISPDPVAATAVARMREDEQVGIVASSADPREGKGSV